MSNKYSCIRWLSTESFILYERKGDRLIDTVWQGKRLERFAPARFIAFDRSINGFSAKGEIG